ncbi:hypothetical protein G6W42_06925 [Campylobacter concisus]|uniref:hypothetical protein n=2 Tax=Campylobacter concisus TaxID=199 RepID=UPI00122CE2EE|nr:hypothetical protein [Campylobacter concisus]MBE9852351.1 hypothetical protein [Campylobacter concisus]
MNNETNMILTFSSDIRATRDSLDMLIKLPELNKFIPKLKINRKNALKKSMVGAVLDYVKIRSLDEVCRA